MSNLSDTDVAMTEQTTPDPEETHPVGTVEHLEWRLAEAETAARIAEEALEWIKRLKEYAAGFETFAAIHHWSPTPKQEAFYKELADFERQALASLTSAATEEK